MKEMEEKANKELKELYTEYLEGKEVKEKANLLHQKYLTASPMLSSETSRAINRLVDIYVDTGVKKPNKKETEEIIKGL